MVIDMEDDIEMAENEVEDCCGVDYGALERDIQAQRVVALEEQRLDAAIEELLKLEKQMRCAADITRTRKVVVAIIQLCYEARAWKTLNDQILLLSRRQTQLKQAVRAMVQQAILYLDDTPDLDTRNELINTLQNVSVGKGLRKVCWYVVLAPHDQPQPTLGSSSLNATKQFELPKFCDQSQELPCAPTFQSRPSTPSPNFKMEVEETTPSLSKLPAKKGATTFKKASRPVQRRPYNSPSPTEMEEFFSKLEKTDQRHFTEKYNFDPVKDIPLPGRFEWVSLQPQPTPDTSGHSLQHIRPE